MERDLGLQIIGMRVGQLASTCKGLSLARSLAHRSTAFVAKYAIKERIIPTSRVTFAEA